MEDRQLVFLVLLGLPGLHYNDSLTYHPQSRQIEWGGWGETRQRENQVSFYCEPGGTTATVPIHIICKGGLIIYAWGVCLLAL